MTLKLMDDSGKLVSHVLRALAEDILKEMRLDVDLAQARPAHVDSSTRRGLPMNELEPIDQTNVSVHLI